MRARRGRTRRCPTPAQVARRGRAVGVRIGSSPTRPRTSSSAPLAASRQPRLGRDLDARRPRPLHDRAAHLTSSHKTADRRLCGTDGTSDRPTTRQLDAVVAAQRRRHLLDRRLAAENDVLYVTQNNVALWRRATAASTGRCSRTAPATAGVRRHQPDRRQQLRPVLRAGPKLRRVTGCDDSAVPTRCPAATDLTDGAPTATALGTDITGAAHDDAPTSSSTPLMPRRSARTSMPTTAASTARTTARRRGSARSWACMTRGSTTSPARAGRQSDGPVLRPDGFRLWYSTDGGATWGNPYCCDIWELMADAERVISTKCCPTTTLRQRPPTTRRTSRR